MEKRLREALVLLQRALIVNGKAKQYNSLYEDKVYFINRSIDLIVRHQLPIKYGWGADDEGNSVVYFEYRGKQVSFHDPFDQIDCKKSFQGEWIGVPQTRSPFAGILNRMS